MFDKRSTIEALLEGDPSSTLRLQADSRKEGVKLPMQWMNLATVSLDITPSLNTYNTDESALHVYLGFSGMWVTCVLPWECITHAMRQNEGAIVWAPSAVDRPPPAPVRQKALSVTNGQAVGRATKHRHLRIIDGGKSLSVSKAKTVPPPPLPPGLIA